MVGKSDKSDKIEASSGASAAAPQVVLQLRLEHLVVRTDNLGRVDRAEGAIVNRFEGGPLENQVQRLLSAVAEWCKSVAGIEVDFQTRQGD
jgi:hypothetical protein